MIDPHLHQRLSRLLGHACLHRGRTWRLLDLLPQEGVLVLECTDGGTGIQLDQFGRASHRAPDLHQVPLLSEDRDAPSHELEELLRNLPWDQAPRQPD
ncbi:MAG: hypothetical protein ACM3ST_11800 [Bdellovibrio bacteriovorus]